MWETLENGGQGAIMVKSKLHGGCKIYDVIQFSQGKIIWVQSHKKWRSKAMSRHYELAHIRSA